MPQTLTLFPLLPTELRLKIWDYAFHFFPRIIELMHQDPESGMTVPYKRWIAMASTNLPLLQVNREVRYEFQPRYSSPFNPGEIGPFHPSSLLINYEIDTIYFRVGIISYALSPKLLSHIFTGAEGEVRNKLKRLAGNDRFWRNLIPTNNGSASSGFRQFDHFQKLEEINVVPGLEQQLDRFDSLVRLERFVECEPTSQYEAGYLPWFNEGFNSIPRSMPVSIKLCKEVAKLGVGPAR